MFDESTDYTIIVTEDVTVCCPSGVLCLGAFWRQQPGVLHDSEQKLHHELVKEQLLWSVCGTQQGPENQVHPQSSLKHAHKCEHRSLFLYNSLSLKHSYCKDKHTISHTNNHQIHSSLHSLRCSFYRGLLMKFSLESSWKIADELQMSIHLLVCTV